MPGHQMTMLIPPAARAAYDQLVAALGTENTPGQWMAFMRTVTRLLPDVLSSGRPSKEAIQRCPIGQLGFSSWQEMIEAPTDVSGLGWNFSAWKAWRRAWSVVQAYPWLETQPLTSSEVNTLALDCKRDDLPFPQSAEELEALRQARKDAQEQRRTESVQALTLRAETAEKALQEATARISALSAQSDQAIAHVRDLVEELAELKAKMQAVNHDQEKVTQLAEQVGSLKAQAVALTTERDRWKKEAEKPAKPLPRLSRWEHLQAFFRGQ